MIAFSVALGVAGCGNDKSGNVSAEIQNQTEKQDPLRNTSIISEEEARSIALTDAQVEAEAVTNIRIKFTVDDGRQVYDVEFYVTNQEYDYEIDAVTGEITEKDMEIENDFGSQATSDASVSIEEAKKLHWIKFRVLRKKIYISFWTMRMVSCYMRGQYFMSR